MIRRLATLFCAPLLLAAADPSTPTIPAVLQPYMTDGHFAPGDYGWARGRFDDAPPESKAAFATVEAFMAACRTAGQARARADLTAMGVDASALEAGGYGDGACAEVALPPFPQTASWPAFQQTLAEARPYADTYLYALGNAQRSASPDSFRTVLLTRPMAEQMLRHALNWGAGADAAAPALPDDVRAMVTAILGARLGELDRENTRWLKQVMAEEGWPARSKVGDNASQMAWLMAQHADHDPAFQLAVLRAMAPMRAAGEVSPRNHAYLYDRVMLKIAGRQRFGTQMACTGGTRGPRPLEDAAALDRLRAEATLEPMAEYLAGMNEMFGPCPPVSPAAPKA